MKKTMVRIILVAGILLAMSATAALPDGGGIPPVCWPPSTNCVR